MKVTHAPVVLTIYKRSDTLRRLVNVLREVKPQKIYVIADGPKNSQEKAACELARQVIDEIDWECDLRKEYARTNLGLKQRFTTGLSWVFTQEEKAIILEDDCLPEISFFRYCDELLERYKNVREIVSISGNNFQKDKITRESYYFSRYPHIWGWATWKRVWKQYDGDIQDWPNRRSAKWPLSVTKRFFITKYWRYIFDQLYQGKINTWDYQLTYQSFAMNGFNIIPSINLVTNVGIGREATNTKNNTHVIGRSVYPITFPLQHPDKIEVVSAADRYIEETVFLNTAAKISLLVKSIFGLL